MDQDHLLALSNFLIGGLFVLFSALDRFNTPQSNRSSTTALRYHLAAFCYVTAGLGLYCALVMCPPLVTHPLHEIWYLAAFLPAETAAGHAPAQAASPSDLSGFLTGVDLASAPLVALLLAVLLPKIPILADADTWIRQRFQRLALIPFEVRRLAAELRDSPFHISPELRAETEQHLLHDGFSHSDAVFENTRTLASTWTKTTALMLRLEAWEAGRKFSGFIAESRPARDHLERRYRGLTAKVRNCLRTLREMAPEDRASKAGDLVKQFETELNEQSTALLGDVFGFISRGLLQCGITQKARAEELGALGFDPSGIPFPGLTLNHLMSLLGLIGLAALACFFAFHHHGERPIGLQLKTAVLIAIVYTVAIACAVYPKEWWAFARRGPDGFRPVAFYFAAASAAALACLAVNFVFELASRNLDLNELWRQDYAHRPWALSSFFAAAAVAWALDDEPLGKPARISLRWREALIGMVTLAAASSLIHQALWDRALKVHLPGPEPLSHILPLSAAIGFLIGYLVPTWYRDAPRQAGAVAEVKRAEPIQPREAAA